MTNSGSAEQLSVRERMQRFNRMASETDLPSRPSGGTTTPTKKRTEKVSDLLYFSSASLSDWGRRVNREKERKKETKQKEKAWPLAWLMKKDKQKVTGKQQDETKIRISRRICRVCRIRKGEFLGSSIRAPPAKAVVHLSLSLGFLAGVKS